MCVELACASVHCGLGEACRAGVCGPCPGGARETDCTDGQDNDCDGAVDCADSDCAGASCGTEGKLYIDRNRFEFRPLGRNAQPTVVKAFSDLDLDHVQNFLECVRSRKLPNGDVLIGHRSAQASHLGNIAYALNRPLKWDPVKEEFPGDEIANAFRDRARREPWTI
jgi:hypothetical protein